MHWRRKWHPLQCSCLENPRNGGAWWAAVYGVAQSRTRLKWLSSSSNNTCLWHKYTDLHPQGWYCFNKVIKESLTFHWTVLEMLTFTPGLSYSYPDLSITSCMEASSRTGQHLCVALSDSAQFSRSVVSDSLWPHGLQHARLPCPSPTPGAYSNSCPLCWWCHPTISSSVVPFSSCLQSFPASGSFQMNQFSNHVAKVLAFQHQHQSFQWIFRFREKTSSKSPSPADRSPANCNALPHVVTGLRQAWLPPWGRRHCCLEKQTGFCLQRGGEPTVSVKVMCFHGTPQTLRYTHIWEKQTNKHSSLLYVVCSISIIFYCILSWSN